MALKHGGTKYGPWLDDTADFVSFGLAPAYMVIMRGGTFALFFAVIYVVGVAYRLVRFVTKDKDCTDLPAGIFNGFPSPAGALIVFRYIPYSRSHVALFFYRSVHSPDGQQ